MKRRELPSEVRYKICALEQEVDRLTSWIIRLCYLMGALVIAAEIACIVAAVG